MGPNIPDQDKELGSFVRTRRRANGLTQTQLGDLAGVGVRAVSELERGKPTIRLDIANAVLAVFNKCVRVVAKKRDEIEL